MSRQAKRKSTQRVLENNRSEQEPGDPQNNIDDEMPQQGNSSKQTQRDNKHEQEASDTEHHAIENGDSGNNSERVKSEENDEVEKLSNRKNISPKEHDDSENNSERGKSEENDEVEKLRNRKNISPKEHDGKTTPKVTRDWDTIKSRRPLRQDSPSASSVNIKWLWCSFVAVIGFIFFYFINPVFYTYSSGEKIVERRPHKEFLDELMSKYPSQNEDDLTVFIKQVKFAENTKDIISKSAVYTLLHYKNTELANAIGRDMVKFAAERFHNSALTFSLDGSYLSNAYFPDNIQPLKERIEGTGTLLVTNFDKVPSGTVKFFHMICDKYTPFINNKAVYVLILGTNDRNLLTINDDNDLRMCADLTMRTIWSDLKQPILEPLITRLSENVMKIYPG